MRWKSHQYFHQLSTLQPSQGYVGHWSFMDSVLCVWRIFITILSSCTLWRIIQQVIIMAFPVPPKLAALYRPRSMSRQLSVSMSLTNKGLLNPTGENNCFLNSTVQVSVRIELLLLTVLLPFTAFLSHLTSCPSLFPKTLPSLLLPPTCSSPPLFLVFRLFLLLFSSFLLTLHPL